MDKQSESQAFEIEVDFAPLRDPEPEPAAPLVPEDAAPVPPPAGEAPMEDVTPEPAPPPVPARSLRRRLPTTALPLVLAGLGLFSGLIASIGLIVVSRNIAEGNHRIAELQEALKSVPAVSVASTGSPIARAPAGDVAGDAPASIEDIRAMLFAFRRDLASYQNGGGGNAAWLNAVRDSQAELANRLNVIAEKVDRIDRRINGSRPASPAADPARPS